MPLYEFECKKCKHPFDKVMSIKEMEAEQIECPKCGSGEVIKLISSGAIKIGLGGYTGKIR
jgi:putative FmdB family regulatory protein